jgi:ribosome biogenesis GTPase / thiamine phosphate phosphatase
LRISGIKSTNPIAVGDVVEYSVELNGESTISKIHPRTNYIIRQSPRKKHNIHLIASNVDQAMLIVTMVDPDVKTGFIDRFLLMTEPYNIPVIIVFNKSDLYGEYELEVFNYYKEVYEKIGYTVILSSVKNSDSMALIKDILKDKITFVGGQSGVGKSTLINTIQPQLSLRTEEISEYSGKGQHTTTFAEMFDLDFGGSIIDTPGIKLLAFNHLEIMDVAHNFREIFKFSEDCKYNNCTHRNEPKCAVKQAVEDQIICDHRYYNYLQLVIEVEDQNYWEVHDDV